MPMLLVGQPVNYSPLSIPLRYFPVQEEAIHIVLTIYSFVKLHNIISIPPIGKKQYMNEHETFT